MIRIVKGFGIVNKAEIDVFLELSCFFNLQLKFTTSLGALVLTTVASPVVQHRPQGTGASAGTCGLSS